MEDYELNNAARWEDTEKKAPVRKRKKKKKKSVASSVAGSVAGSIAGSVARPVGSAAGFVAGSVAGPVAGGDPVVGSVQGHISRPITPIQPIQSPLSPSSSRGGAPLPSSTLWYRNDWSTPSEPDLLTPEEGVEQNTSWGREAPYREQSSESNTNSGYQDYYYHGHVPELDEPASHSSYILPNFYFNEDPLLEFDGYEGPDGLMRENDGDRAERAGEPHSATFVLPTRRHPAFDDRFFGPRSINLRHIAAKTNTHLEMPENMNEPEILMWGKPTQIAIAKRDLIELMQHIFRDIEGRAKMKKTLRADPNFAWKKVKAAPSDRRQQRIEKAASEDAKRRSFRHPPPKEPFEFRAIGSFIWPLKDTNPQDSLGKSFELLDDVRYECEVYIIFSREKGMFQILGDNPDNVEKATDRIFGAFCEIAAKNRRPSLRFLAHTPSIDLPKSHVSLLKNHTLEGRHLTTRPELMSVQVVFSGDAPSQKFLEDWGMTRAKLEKANYLYLKRVAQQGLNDVLYLRGYVTLKIHFGTLVLFNHPEPTADGLFPLEDFCELIRDPNGRANGEVIRSIGEEHAAKALVNECLKRKDLFQPVETSNFAFDESFGKAITERDNNDYIPPHSLTPEPALGATFKLEIYDSKGVAHEVRLEIEFVRIPGNHPGELTNDGGELYKAGIRRWLYIRSTAGNPKDINKPQIRRKELFDIKVLDLENDLAWQFELTTHQRCKDADIYPIFTEFVRNIRIEDIPDESDTIPPPIGGERDLRRRVKRVVYVSLPGMTVENVILKTKYQYWIKRTPYMFEVTRYECFPTEEVNSLWANSVSISWKGIRPNHDTRWGASLSNQNWTSALLKQTEIGIGCTGGWDPDVNMFFKSSEIGGFDHPPYTREGEAPDPWEGDGWKELMTRIEECLRLIAKARTESLQFARPGHVGPEEYD